MHTLRYALAVGAAVLLASPSADAQLRRTSTSMPSSQSLPAGTCRIWIDGLPPERQPAPMDCETARRTAPRNSRIIYGDARSGSVYGNRDPRSIPGTPQYDPRYDPRSPQYDPRLDPHARGRQGEKWERKREKERAKWERKQEKERRKEWKRAHKDRDHDGDDDDDDDDEHEGRRGRNGGYGVYGSRGQDGRGCIDANRDGICDDAQSSTLPIPLPIPRTDPQGPSRRVCVDANRDGKCDDGGPLVRSGRP